MYKIGERVKLKWCGDNVIPKYLNHSWATVEDITPKGNLKVRADIEDRTRIVNPNKHIIK